jgi:hypothetical protein
VLQNSTVGYSKGPITAPNLSAWRKPVGREPHRLLFHRHKPSTTQTNSKEQSSTWGTSSGFAVKEIPSSLLHSKVRQTRPLQNIPIPHSLIRTLKCSFFWIILESPLKNCLHVCNSNPKQMNRLLRHLLMDNFPFNCMHKRRGISCTCYIMFCLCAMGKDYKYLSMVH